MRTAKRSLRFQKREEERFGMGLLSPCHLSNNRRAIGAGAVYSGVAKV